MHRPRYQAPCGRRLASERAACACRRARAAPPARCCASSVPTFSFRVATKQAGKLRLDTYAAAQIAAQLAASPDPAAAQQDVSRARVQAAIAAGLVTVNGRPAAKPAQQLRPGDAVRVSLPPPPPTQALPEAIPLDVRYEDDHVLVVNKPAGMVVHVAPGHHSGTLVNALLHHCALAPIALDPAAADPLDPAGGAHGARLALDPAGLSSSDDVEDGGDDDDGDDAEGAGEGDAGALAVPPRAALPGHGSAACAIGASSSSSSSSSCLRPGIVHRLDRGTSGLLVVAKTEAALVRLQAQFKARTVDRLYESVTVGCPAGPSGRVEANIVRDPRDRKRMAAAAYGSGRGRTAASGYRVLRPLAGGGAALVQWRLDTGRTHQIRVHAKHMGHPLLGDDTYGGTGAGAVAAVARGGLPAVQVQGVVEQLGRPALHARTLGFTHPITGERLAFEQPPPDDFVVAVRSLQG